jgi:shikimate dehydrogenase
MNVTARSRVFAVIGDPVTHSLSPRMQNAAFTALGLDAVYVALRESATGLDALMRTLIANGGGGNITLPHKQAAAHAVDDMRGPATDVCNTFWGEEGRLIGDNTDVVGVQEALVMLGVAAAREPRWLVLGTGGSARAVALAAAGMGAAIAVRSRQPARAEAFLAAAHDSGVPRADPDTCQVVINCTPLGLENGDVLPLEPGKTPAARWALDLVYAPGETAWVHAMRAAGCRAADGREVLVRQGGAALERWFPGQRAPLEVMRAAVGAALG